MGNRMRFKPAERELILSTLDVEVSYGSGRWIAFRLDDNEIRKDYDGYQRSAVGTVVSDTNTKGEKCGAIGKGWRMYATPGHVRPVGSDWKVS